MLASELQSQSDILALPFMVSFSGLKLYISIIVNV